MSFEGVKELEFVKRLGFMIESGAELTPTILNMAEEIGQCSEAFAGLKGLLQMNSDSATLSGYIEQQGTGRKGRGASRGAAEEKRGNEFVQSVAFMLKAGAKLDENTIPKLLEMAKGYEREGTAFGKLVGYLESAQDSGYVATLMEKLPGKIDELLVGAQQALASESGAGHGKNGPPRC